MSDFPAMDAMQDPWREPGLYHGDPRWLAPALAYDGGQVGMLTVRAGCASAEKRRPDYNCNDAFGIWAHPDGPTCVMAVADGVRTTAAAGRAARAAVTLALVCAKDRLAGGVLPTESTLAAIFLDVQTNLEKNIVSDENGLPDETFRTTLVVALLQPLVAAGSRVNAVVGRIGDSTAWRMFDGSFESVFDLAPSTFQTATDYLPGHYDSLDIRTVQVCDGEVLALTTDGLARSAPGEKATPFLQRMWAVPPTPLEFLASLAVRRNDRQDDRAAAVAWVGHYESRWEGEM